MAYAVRSLDHLVVNCSDVERSAAWYARLLGMRVERFGPDRRIALHFGSQKLNLRPVGAPEWEAAADDSPGTQDLCFVVEAEPDETLRHLAAEGVAVTTGPVERLGARGPMTSIYCRDPDGNLIELARYPG
ncbi:MAG: VOC family protein [Candidatus Dormibacteraeota bacterium]|nr:VOC family protein [Candidatus Dormibacteraeota bacterium]